MCTYIPPVTLGVLLLFTTTIEVANFFITKDQFKKSLDTIKTGPTIRSPQQYSFVVLLALLEVSAATHVATCARSRTVAGKTPMGREGIR